MNGISPEHQRNAFSTIPKFDPLKPVLKLNSNSQKSCPEWKNFCHKILREIDFKDSSSQNYHFDIFEVLKLEFDEILQFLKVEMFQNQNLEPSDTEKLAVFELIQPSKLVSRKI